MKSLRAQLAILLTCAVLLLSVLVWGFTLVENRTLAQRLQDEGLQAIAFGVFLSAIDNSGDYIAPEEFEAFVPSSVDRYYYRVVGPNSSYISGYQFVQVPRPADAENGQPVFANFETSDGERFRGLSLRFFIDASTRNSQGWATLEVAQSRRRADRLLLQEMRSFTIGIVLVALTAIAALLFALTRVFAPVQALTRSLERRTPSDLAEIQQEVPSELAPLKRRLNELFGAVAQQREDREQLISTAAHQLRTPLTAMRLRLALATEELPKSANLAELTALLDGNIRLTNQLLALEPRQSQAKDKRFAVPPMVAGLARAWFNRFRDAGISLEYEDRTAGHLSIVGDPIELQEALANLFDNQLKHSDATAVTVIVNDNGIVVGDNGKGVPADALPKLGDRFYRLAPTKVDGSGLGLSIVKAFVARLNGTVTFEDAAPGLRVRMTF